jgi:predicted nucleic acid-binding protein
MICLIDTSAWVEYLKGSVKGARIKDIVDNQSNILIVHSVVLSELASKLARDGKSTLVIYDVLGLGNLKLVDELPLNSALDAGKEHAILKKAIKRISLIDVMLMKVADTFSATIVTTDHHFEAYKKAVII